jgi:hypothetical protein
LLSGIKTNSEDVSTVFKKKDLRQQMQEREGDEDELDIKFNVGFGEDIGKKYLEGKEEKKKKNE